MYGYFCAISAVLAAFIWSAGTYIKKEKREDVGVKQIGAKMKLPENFSWKHIFSEVFKPHTREQLSALLTRGIGGVPLSPAEMLSHWQKPWLFFRIAAAGGIVSVIIYASLEVFMGNAMIVMAVLLPSLVIPLAVVMLYWEMDLSGQLSLVKTLILLLLGGILSLSLTGFIRVFLISEEPFIAGPIPEEAAKLAVTWLFIYICRCRFGITGVLIGGIVGGGFAGIETAGYALNQFMETDGQMGLVQGIQEMRGWLAPGGHVVWSAFYGGALALTIEPDGGRIGSRVWKDPLVLMSWCTAVLFHTVWNLTAGDMAGGLPEELVYFWERLELSRVKYILLILSAWGYLLFILRRCVWQIFAYCAVYNGGRRERGEKCRRIGNQVFIYALGKGQMVREYQLPRGGSLAFGRDPGAAGVMFPVSTRGISRIHCEISFRGETPVLKDCASTYGTFFSNRRRLRPGKEYPLKDGMVFYLAERENSFKVRILE